MSNYAIMTMEKYEQIKAQLDHGHRKSLDESQVVAKLSEGQEPEGTTIKNHEQTLELMAQPEWTPENPEGE